MDYLQYLDAYRRYTTNSAVVDKKRDIVQDYASMKRWLVEKCTNELYSTLMGDCIWRAVKAVADRKIVLKDVAGLNWSSDKVKEAYRLIRILKRISADDYGFIYDRDNYERYWDKWFKLAAELKDEPACQLYLWQCCLTDVEEERNIFKRFSKEVDKLLQCSTEEEVKRCIASCK